MHFARHARGRRGLVVAATLIVLWGAADSGRAATGLLSGFQDVPVVSGLSSPTAMDFAPDGRLFVAQTGGQLRVIKNGVLLSTPFLTLIVDAAGERGLLGIAFDPNFASCVGGSVRVSRSPREAEGPRRDLPLTAVNRAPIFPIV